MHNLTKYKEPVSTTPDMYKSDGVNLANYCTQYWNILDVLLTSGEVSDITPF